MHRHRHRTRWTLAAVLVIAGCARGDDTGDPPTTITSTSTSNTTSDSATNGVTDATGPDTTNVGTDASVPDPTTDIDAADDCLAAPVQALEERTEAGTIDERRNDRVEVDCQEVFGGETLLEQAVLASDGSGSAKFRVGNIAECSLLPRSMVQIRPEANVVLRVDGGETTCSVFGDAENGFQAGESLAVVTTAARLIVSVDENGPVTITVIDGLVTLASPEFDCRSVVGPGQRAVVQPAALPTVTAINLATLSPGLIGSIGDVGGTIERAPVPDGLLPGLSSLFDNGDVAIGVDGDIAGSQEADDVADVEVLEAITGRDIVFDRIEPGRIDVGQRIDPPDLVVADGLDQIRVLPPIPIAADDVEEALDDTIDELVLIPILADGDGRVWTIAFDGSTSDVQDAVADELRRATDSGAYGSFYEARFGLTPDYSVVRPELLGGTDSCG